MMELRPGRRFASYLRESTIKQDNETQRAHIQAYWTQKNVLGWEFADDDKSGKIPFDKRPGSRKLLDAIIQGLIEELVVYRLDRLGRNKADTDRAIEKLLKLGVRLVSLKEGLQDGTAAGKLKTSIFTSFAEYEVAVILERSKDTTERLVKEGFVLGGNIPYGYRKGGGKHGHFVLATDPIPGHTLSEVDVIVMIFEMAADGKSTVAIARHLTSLGVPTGYIWDAELGKRKLNPAGIWGHSHVRELIVMKTYMGLHEYNKRRHFRDEDGVNRLKARPREEWDLIPCPAIVSKDLWERANIRMHQNQIAAMAHAKNKYLLKQKIKCGLCNHAYMGTPVTRPNGKKESYYRCNGKIGARGLDGENGKRCPSPSVRGGWLEVTIWGFIRGWLMCPDVAKEQLKQKIAAEGDVGVRVEKEIRMLESQRAKTADRRKLVLRQVGMGLFKDDEIKQELDSINAENSVIDGRLSELRKISTDAATDVLCLDWAGRLIGELRDELLAGTLTFEMKRRFVEILVAGITVTPVAGQKLPQIKVKFRFSSDLEQTRKGMPVACSALDNMPAHADIN